jgi:pimeloyl-ACP methyl ester carboxylesterase
MIAPVTPRYFYGARAFESLPSVSMHSTRLEVLRYTPPGTKRRTPLLFIHGAYVAAWCWDEHFLPYFAKQGYAVHAPSLRGHGGSHGRESFTLASVDDYVADMLSVAESLQTPPVLVGHSMGATVVQRGLARSRAPAAVLMAPVPAGGLAGPAFLLAARDPRLFHDLSAIQSAWPENGVRNGLRRVVFSDELPEVEALRHLRRMQPESQRALFDLSWPQFFLPTKMPVLVLGAGRDALFSPAMVDATARAYGVSAEIFPGMAHAMMLEPDWRKVADRMLDWLEERGI